MVFDGADFMIIIARWNFYLGLPPSDPFYRSSTLVDDQPADRPADPYELMARGLAAAIVKAKRVGVRRVLVIGPFPEFPVHPSYCLMRAIRVGIDGCAIGRVVIEARRARTMQTLHRATAGIEGVRVIDPINLFCTERECQPHEGRTLYFSDSNHLSTAGAARFYQAYEDDFLWALVGDEDRDRLRRKPSNSNTR
jgi:hypothetical protein